MRKKTFFHSVGEGGCLLRTDGRRHSLFIRVPPLPQLLAVVTEEEESPRVPKLDWTGPGRVPHSGWGLIVELFGPFSPPHLSLSSFPPFWLLVCPQMMGGTSGLAVSPSLHDFCWNSFFRRRMDGGRRIFFRWRAAQNPFLLLLL